MFGSNQQPTSEFRYNATKQLLSMEGTDSKNRPNAGQRRDAFPGFVSQSTFGNSVTTRTQTSTTTPDDTRGVSSVSLPNAKSGVFGAYSNMVNSVVGAGIIGMPYAISNAGIVLGVLLLVVVSIMTDKTLRMMVEMAAFHPKLQKLGVRTYEDLARVPFGRLGSRLISTGMLVMAYGAMLAYLLIIKDSVPSILGLTSEAGKGTFIHAELPMLVTSLVVIVPLSMMRDMASLEKTSLVSVMADVVLVGFVISFSPIQTTLSEEGGFVEVLKDNAVNSRAFIGLGVLSTAMACQHCAFLVSNSLQDLTSRRWSTVSFFSIWTSGLLCLAMGVSGYLGFMGDTHGNILNNFGADSVIANAGRGLLAVTMVFTYPMEAFVARHVLVDLLYDGDLDGNDGDSVIGRYFGRRHRLTWAIYIATLVPALIVDDLGPVLSITGALGASMIGYVGVGSVYLGINGEDFLFYCVDMLTRRRGLEQLSTTEFDTNKPNNNGGTLGMDDGTKGNGADILSQCQTMMNHHQDQYDDQNTKRIPIIEVEMPTMGNATEKQTPISSEETAEELLSKISKPCWWYLGGFPIWTAIATRGPKGTRNFLLEFPSLEDEDDENGNVGEGPEVELNSNHKGDEKFGNSLTGRVKNESPVIGPRVRDYYVSMYLITFGILAAVIGLGSNMYFIWMDHFYNKNV